MSIDEFTSKKTEALSATYHFSSEILIKSCPLPKSMISHKNGRKHTSLTITAFKIESLSSLLKRNKKHLEYSVMEELIASIGRQLQILERENKGISDFIIDDITAFHSDATSKTVYFAITNDEKIHDINEHNQLVITTPYPKEKPKTLHFHSPEFKEFLSKKTLPYEIHFKSGYYSFGLLCVYCYLSRSAPDTTHNTTHDTTHDTITNTKIYWFLKQVLQENPTARRYICA
jgi:hypothetical protein